ncbi:tRNA pseudouridine(55) synthase TruB [Candidatus Magnetomonas plexicatena]|uniref:tRNA pseudouridine(55) synthase TruB n=1 Tax=Candidatus Magnetomonas plexicatena TaxID=2552947 RepID=UPI001C76C447|nr:tRNA pseudouridine(55) synthase TruB [Nitrospirales bacterium LBB_01]
MNLVINLNKPTGITSHSAIQKLKYEIKARKVGHAGTLDPLAEGVLIVMTGRATKLSGYFVGLDKEYVATIKLGTATDTLDSEGRVVKETPVAADVSEHIEAALSRFRGTIEQTPPMFSALKSNGQPLYKLARQGIEIERAKRSVTIYELQLLGFESPFLTIRVLCSKGTYVRTLAADLAEELGTCGHIHSLVRTRVGDFTINDSFQLQTTETENRGIYSMDKALSHLDEITLDEHDMRDFLNGKITKILPASDTGDIFYKVKDFSGALIAIAKMHDNGIRLQTLLRSS